MANYYEILEIQEGASTNEIRQAYRRLALRWHPDKNPNETEEATRRFKEISEAYEILSDARQRESYDRDLRNERRQSRSEFQPGPNTFTRGSFAFRTPDEVFAQFFGTFAESFGNAGFPFSSGFMSDDDPFDIFSNLTNDPTNSAFTGINMSSSSSNGPFTSTFISSTTTSQRNGKSTKTTTNVANGIETTKVYENGRLISETTRTVDGRNPSTSTRHPVINHSGAPPLPNNERRRPSMKNYKLGKRSGP